MRSSRAAQRRSRPSFDRESAPLWLSEQPTLWRGLALLLLGAGVLIAFIGGDLPSDSSRALAALALSAFFFVALIATLRRRSLIGGVIPFDLLVLFAFALSAIGSTQAMIPTAAAHALQWQASLVALYFGARLIGPALVQPALALWVVATIAFTLARFAAKVSNPEGTAALALRALSPLTLVEWALALVLLAAVWTRVRWSLARPSELERKLRRALHALVIGAALATHLFATARGDLSTLWHRARFGWDVARAVYWQSPLWGWGSGAWSAAFASLDQPPALDQPFAASAPAAVAAAGGALGILVMLILIVAFVFALATVRSRHEMRQISPPLLALVSVAILWGIAGLWSIAPVRPCNIALLAFLAGACLSSHLHAMHAEETHPVLPRGESRPLLWSAVMGVTLILAISLVLPGLLVRWIARADSDRAAMERARIAGAWLPWEVRFPMLEARRAALILWRGGEDAIPRELIGRIDQACRIARDLDPYLQEAYTLPATALWEHGADRTAARALYEEGLVRLPRDKQMTLFLAEVQSQEGDVAGALHRLRAYDALEPTPVIKVTLARLAWSLGDRAAAEQFAREALQLDNRSPALITLLQDMRSGLLTVLPVVQQ
jgi:hypothetical protein